MTDEAITKGSIHTHTHELHNNGHQVELTIFSAPGAPTIELDTCDSGREPVSLVSRPVCEHDVPEIGEAEPSSRSSTPEDRGGTIGPLP